MEKVQDFELDSRIHEHSLEHGEEIPNDIFENIQLEELELNINDLPF